MQRNLILIILFAIPFSSLAQREGGVIEGPVINIEGRNPKGEGGPRGEAGTKGGGDGGKKSDGGPKTTVTVGAGKVTVSQKASNQLIAVLQDFFGTDFWSSLFSPSTLPGDGTNSQLVRRIRELENEAMLENRGADVKFFNDAAIRFQNNSTTKMQFHNTEILNAGSPILSLNEPLITHNILLGSSPNMFPGMKITVPGFMSNYQGANVELLVRFYMPNGKPLLANPSEVLYRDRAGLVVTGTGVLPVINRFANLSLKSFQIPYYAFNLPFTNGVANYELRAKASLYVNGKEVSISDETVMNIRY